MINYKVAVVKSHDMTEEIAQFLVDAGFDLSQRYGTFKNWEKCPIHSYSDKHLLMICFYKERPVGVLMARLFKSIFDQETRILFQDLLYATKPKAAKLLLQELLTFGKANADHVISTLGSATNIKPRSMERLGFNKLETLYRLEV